MMTIGQGSSIRGWLIPDHDQKRLTELAVAGQWVRSGSAQAVGAGSERLTASTAEKLRTATSHARSADSSSQNSQGITFDEATGGAMAPGGSTEMMRNQLMNGEDGQFKIVEGLQDFLQGAKQNLAFAKETIKIYESTGEVWSVQPNGKFKFDLSDYGGEEGYMKLVRHSVNSLENYTIPSLTKSVENAKADRLELLREYGLAPPAVNTEA